MRGVDLLILYRIIKILSTPWVKQPAYKYGIIDANGKVLRSYSSLQTTQEKNAYTLLDRFVFNLKRLLSLVPGGKTRIGSYAAALMLLKENSAEFDKDYDDEISVDDDFRSFMEMLFNEDGGVPAVNIPGAPTNNVGSGNIAGLGVGPYGEPPAPLYKKRKRFLKV